MARPQLSNYLLSNRKRLGLSQDDIAYLMGTESGTKICRYEQFACDPRLRTALAYEAIFQKPVRELFGGLYDEIEREVIERAKGLIAKLDHTKPDSRIAHKREMLTQITAPKPNESENP